MEHLTALILAAGEGKRMKSKTHKVVHKMCGRPLIEWVYRSVREAGIEDCILVVGHLSHQVKECMGDKVEYVLQERQLGTGHAVMQAEALLRERQGYVFLTYGDMPLVTPDTISRTVKTHIESGNAATLVTAVMKNPYGYGRVIRGKEGNVERIVEERDATPEQKGISEVNSGMYCFTVRYLLEALKKLRNNNSQGEYYLTDVIEILNTQGYKVGTLEVADPSEVLGINDRAQLAEVSNIARKRINLSLMQSGVTIINPENTYIDADVKIGRDTVVYPGTIMEGLTVVGEDCIIGPNSRLVSATIADSVVVDNSVVMESSVESNTRIGPFAYLRPGSKIGMGVKIGDFVEVKNSTVGRGTSISHLTYVGDSDIGENVNLGCGVVTVNYDGKKKHRTVVGDNAFVGCNVNLVAPVVVHKDSYIAAGSTITDEVPENALAVARCRQVIKEGWVLKRGMVRRKKNSE